MFSNREIKKRYLAILEGTVQNEKGRITLPLCPNIENRPYQMVSYENGKEAVTDYEVFKEENNQTWIWFYPQTGRTHQLRVHAAHPDGLNCAIKGDLLYGTASDRLYLQAQKIEFRHPKTHQLMVFELPVEF
jgi:tRNA pseudouridine32 synthase/23S rRNA pseudouridine746 synthase